MILGALILTCLVAAPPAVTRSVERPTLPMLAVDLKQATSGASPPPGPTRSASTEPLKLAAAAPAPTVTSSRDNNPWRALRRLVAVAFVVLVVGRLGKELSSSTETPAAPAHWASEADAGTVSRQEAKPAEQMQSRVPPGNRGQLSTSRAAAPPDAAQGRALVRAALVGHVRSGATQAVLRQPVLLASTALPTGATLDGTADELPHGRFLLRFDSVRRPDGSVLRVNASALVDASAATRRPLIPGASRPGFEFDLTLSADR